MATVKLGSLAAAGSTGNNTHASVAIPNDVNSIAVEFEITAIGATPTITFKVQGSQDDATDAASDWFDITLNPDDASAAAITYTKTAVSVQEYSCDLRTRPVKKARLVTSANTNITYEADLYGFVEFSDR